MTRILLTGAGREHRYVCNRLLEEGDVDAVIVGVGTKHSLLAQARRLRKKYSGTELVSRAVVRSYLALIGDARDREHALRATLGASSDSFLHRDAIQVVDGINGAEARALVARASEVRLIVYGTGIVGASMLRASARTPLNMHTGISPDYRGSSCAFWPLVNGELDMIGATVHEITSTIDGGRVYGVRHAELGLDDGIHQIFGRAVVAGTELLIDVLRQIDDPEYEASATAQDLGAGREYRSSMRTISTELRARRVVAERRRLDAHRRP